MNRIEELAWDTDRAGEAIEAVARMRGWLARDALRGPAASIPRAADALGLEAEAAALRYASIEHELRSIGAALVVIGDAGAKRLLAVIRTDARSAHVMTPDGGRAAVALRELQEVLCADVESRVAPDVDRVLAMSGIGARRRDHSRAAMLRDLVGDATVSNLWILRPRLENVRAVVRDARLLKKAFAFLSVNAAEMLLFVVSWWILGLMAFDTRSLDTLFVLWLLTVFTIVPLRAAGVVAARSLVLEAGSIIKRRILLGALKLLPDEVNGKGVGTFLSHVLESGAVEAVGTSGAFAGLTSIIVGVFAIYVLSRGAGGMWHVALYLLWIIVAAALTIRFGLTRAAWTEARFAMTGHVVENMTGHKTRLAQKAPHERNLGEDTRLEEYMTTEAAFNRAAVAIDVLRRIWPWAGLFALAPIVATGSASASSLAVAAAGVLLGDTALMQWTDATSGIAAALSAWRRVAPFWSAADRQAAFGSMALQPLLESESAGDAVALLHAASLTYRHARRDHPALDQVELTVKRGDRILLRGPSGSGKSTLSTLLSGVRPLQAGLLFFRGLDLASVGVENWRRRVLLAPQFHANHIFIGTLAYNLLLGGAWPPSASDREDARVVCRGLGLGPLIDSMPLGLEQPVGETGWQLSHGERTRVFLARSILQKPAVMILDETFAALDPSTLEGCMRYVLDHTETLVVIAHP
ncbi:MAG: ATP-binding cassette, subfamily bacterial [Thermoanaerobaculia bacterium]|jgi:ATP-binding cassette subfamily B protein|nr:ATP-binding cassette, subfamily bacterial [Thermoanaerobaculia bacterium]